MALFIDVEPKVSKRTGLRPKSIAAMTGRRFTRFLEDAIFLFCPKISHDLCIIKSCWCFRNVIAGVRSLKFYDIQDRPKAGLARLYLPTNAYDIQYGPKAGWARLYLPTNEAFFKEIGC
jgi:hypothetical protein